MPNTADLQPKRPTVSKVKGPIRCHKCRLNCTDAEHYLNHKCAPAPAPNCSPYPSLAELKVRS